MRSRGTRNRWPSRSLGPFTRSQRTIGEGSRSLVRNRTFIYGHLLIKFIQPRIWSGSCWWLILSRGMVWMPALRTRGWWLVSLLLLCSLLICRLKDDAIISKVDRIVGGHHRQELTPPEIMLVLLDLRPAYIDLNLDLSVTHHWLRAHRMLLRQ